MSVRSMLRPRVKNCHASSRLVEESTMPTASAARSRTHWKNSCTLSVCSRRGIRALVVFRHSHSSVETISRARRAFSREAVSE
jgi:DNA-binding sugar fermentation-stimulating protein